MRRTIIGATALVWVACAGSPASAEMAVWGVRADQIEARFGEDADVFAWSLNAIYGTDELKVVWRSEAEYSLTHSAFERLENQIRLQTPISDFFDAVVGVRADTPDGPDRFSGLVGLHGLAPQWFEIDLDLFVSGTPSLRLEVEYEAVITNRITLVPSIEVDLPFTDDRARDIGAFGPKVELGLRLSYDVIDRLFSPYVGIHFEQKLGETANLAKAAGEDSRAVFFVIGARVLF
jgi:copper resistance protein B